LPLHEVSPPGQLEDRVVTAALARRPATTSAIDGAPARRRSRRRTAALGAIAVAAAIIVAVLVTTRDASSPAPKGQIAAVVSTRADVVDLASAPGARSGAFDRVRGVAVLGRTGRGGMYDLPRREVEVWLDTTPGHSIRLGTATPAEGVIAFTVNHPELVRAIRLTNPDGTELARAVLSAR